MLSKFLSMSRHLSRDMSYVSCHVTLITCLKFIFDIVMWPKFSNSSISMREVIISSIYKDLTRKTNVFEGCSWFKFNNLGLALGMAFKFYTSVEKRLKLSVRKFWGLMSTFVEVLENLVGKVFPAFPLHPEPNTEPFSSSQTLSLISTLISLVIFKRNHGKTVVVNIFRSFDELLSTWKFAALQTNLSPNLTSHIQPCLSNAIS